MALADPVGLRAVVIGASGATGSEVVRFLVRVPEYVSVGLLNRREIKMADAPGYEKIDQRVINFDALSNHTEEFERTSIVICALGTTRGQAGAAGFYKVDHDYVVECAKYAKLAGVEKFILVTAQGANPNSMFLYQKTKGEVERDVKALNFEHLTIFRPAFLERPHPRFMERVVHLGLAPTRWFWPHKYFVPVATLAKAIVFNSLTTSEEKVRIVENADLIQMAKDYDSLLPSEDPE